MVRGGGSADQAADVVGGAGVNASNSRKLALPKPRPRRKVVKRMRVRARVRPVSQKRRAEQRLVGKVFREIEPRDGDCRIWWAGIAGLPETLAGRCEGEPQPAHLSEWRRSKTRGLPASERHNRKTIIRLCAAHHRRYDLHEFDLQHGPEGADGTLLLKPYVKGAAA